MAIRRFEIRCKPSVHEDIENGHLDLYWVWGQDESGEKEIVLSVTDDADCDEEELLDCIDLDPIHVKSVDWVE